MLTAVVTVPHILPIQKLVAAGTDRVAFSTAKHHNPPYRQRDAVGNGVKKRRGYDAFVLTVSKP